MNLLGGLVFVALCAALEVKAYAGSCCQFGGGRCVPGSHEPHQFCCNGGCPEDRVCRGPGGPIRNGGDDRGKCQPTGATCAALGPRCCVGKCSRPVGGTCPDAKHSGEQMICAKPGQRCNDEVEGPWCCKGALCKDELCHAIPTPKGPYDLQPKDLNAFCPKVDRNYRPPSECVYMKWVPCSGVQSDPNRPCGWYQQTKCGDNSNDNGGPNKPNVPQPRFLDFETDRKKRSADEEQQNEELNAGPVFLSFYE